jgi:cytoskeletal protein CcmA (bactofilin family)
VPDNKTIVLGTNSDITIQYDETTNDALEIAANVEGAALGVVLKADQGDDNADQHKLNIADGGVLTLQSKISGGFVTYLTHTPNATVADSTTAVAGNLTVAGDLTLGSGAVISEAELEAIDAVIVDGNKDIASFRNVTLTGELDAGSLDISGDADIDGTLEADAMTLNGTAITATATLDTGISNNNVPKFTSGVADDDFLRVAGTAIEGRSASEVLSDIGGQASLTFGISNTNAVKIDSSSVADDEYARFTANGLESRSNAEVLSDIGAVSQATAQADATALAIALG